MIRYISSLVVISLLLSCSHHNPEETIYHQYQLQEPHQLVLNAFDSSDVVFIGENHFISQHVTFVSELIPTLHQNGINTLYSEFISIEYTPLIDSLITAPEFDEQLAKNLLMLNLWDWPYKEYMELYRSAWKVNQQDTTSIQFKIIGLDKAHDYSVIEAPEDWYNLEKRKAFFVEWEDGWANRIIERTNSSGEKALVYCGLNHALTYYTQPMTKDGEFYQFANRDRVGQYVYEALGNRCTFLSFHIPWDSKDGYDEISVNPLNGKIDSLIRELPSSQKVFGFNTRQSSLGSVIDTAGFYSNGYENFSLSTLCDGYLAIAPICELSLCEFIPNFIDSSNISIAQPQVKAWENIDSISIDSANSLLFTRHQEFIHYMDSIQTQMGCK
jgi:hypothetical protein